MNTCDVHVSVFRDALESHEQVKAPPGHPVHTFMAENTEISKIIGELDPLIAGIAERRYSDNLGSAKQKLRDVIGRKVQNCHPPKSLHIVNRILVEFRTGTRIRRILGFRRAGNSSLSATLRSGTRGKLPRNAGCRVL